MVYYRHEISRKVGWQGKAIEVPSLKHIEELALKAFKGDEDSMILLFKYYRYCPSPTNKEELEVINKITGSCNSLMI